MAGRYKLLNHEDNQHEHLEVPSGIHPEHEEVRESPRFRSWWVGTWFAPLLVSGGILFWCLAIYLLIGNRPRDWDYGVAPYVPGESIFSINPIPRGIPPEQVVLPEDTSDVDNENP